MKILFITTQFPYPLDNGGKIGAFNGISVVSKNNDVTVLSFSEEPQFVQEGINYYKKLLPNVKFEYPIYHRVHIRNNKIKLAQALISGYFKRVPYIVSKFENKNMYNKIDELFNNKKTFDIVFIDYLNMLNYGYYIKKKYNKYVKHFILKDHNLEFELVKQEALSSKGLKRIVLNKEWKRTYSCEMEAVKSFEINFTVCDENTEVLKKINSNTFTMFPTFNILPSNRKIPKEKTILYIGNLSWKSNLEGITWFVKNVFPELKEKISNATLTIIGGGCTDNLFSDIPGINYLGYVKDISNIYDDYRAFIVPLFEGSGIRIKILEAFNHEVPVVSTKLGCDTIGVKNGKELLIAENREEFIEALIKLLNDDDQYIKMRKAAKKLLHDKFSLEKRQQEFNNILLENYKEK